MKTSFFNQLYEMNIQGDLHITVTKGTSETLVVSVILKNDHCTDEAKNLIPPYILKGTCEELDEGFFDKIKTPIEAVSGLMVDMEGYLKQVEEVKKNSAMQKVKTEEDQKGKDSKEKKYGDAIAKAEALGARGKPREAWSALPKIADFPEYADEIREKKEVYERQFAPEFFPIEEINNQKI